MDRRVFLAVILTAVVIVVTPLLFPGVPRPTAADSIRAESAASQATVSQPASTEVGGKSEVRERGSNSATVVTAPSVIKPELRPAISDSIAARSQHMTVWYGDRGASPLRVVLSDYDSRDTARSGGPVVLEPAGGAPLLAYDLQTQDSSISLSSSSLHGTLQTVGTSSVVTYVGELAGHAVRVTYTSPASNAERYLVHADFSVQGIGADAKIWVHLPPSLASMETDTTDDIRHLAYGYRTAAGDVESLAFGKLDSGSVKAVSGPLEWAALRNKYFLVAVMTPDSAIAGATFSGAPRVAKLAPDAHGAISIPLKNGRAMFDLYLGPQEFERLRALGHGLDQVNPYAGWFHSVVQPFATIVTRVLLWMKHTTGLGYGWVIIIFGVLVRLLLWPLNQSAMRTSIRMQRIQPELAEVQKKYKSDPKKQQEALVKLYQSHGMTPFSPMMGCLPMMLPMPILFALYFVFLNTIEFRGVSFLWMHDISAADPYYITPLVMGLSMFALSWIGMRGTPPTAQTRMMSYMMPVVLTFMFFRFAAGLNLYYAVQNIAAVPQQWLLARERAGATGNSSGPPRRSSG